MVGKRSEEAYFGREFFELEEGSVACIEKEIVKINFYEKNPDFECYILLILPIL